MANEIRLSSSVTITKGKIDFRPKQTTFTANMAGSGGPAPGQVTATVEGVNVDLSELTTPGVVKLTNIDATNFVEYGIWDGTEFYPLGELLAGEVYILRLSRNLGKSFGTGTGTVDTGTYSLRLKADTASVKVIVEAFEA